VTKEQQLKFFLATLEYKARKGKQYIEKKIGVKNRGAEI